MHVQAGPFAFIAQVRCSIPIGRFVSDREDCPGTTGREHGGGDGIYYGEVACHGRWGRILTAGATLLLVLCVSGFTLPMQVPPGAASITYHGGPIVTSSTTFAIFWIPPGYSFVPPPLTDSSYEERVVHYLQDVSDTSFYNVLAQYGPAPDQPISGQSTFGGLWIDSREYPRSGTDADPLQDVDVQAEVRRAASVNNWPLGLSSVYFLFTPEHIESCRTGGMMCTFSPDTALCGWHGSFGRDQELALYAVLPDDWTVPGCANDGSASPAIPFLRASDIETRYASHEQFELVTDPLGDGWHDSGGAEIADICESTAGDLQADGSNVSLHGNRYLVQPVWSNADSACVLAAMTPSAGTPPPSLLSSRKTATIAPTNLPLAGMPASPTAITVTSTVISTITMATKTARFSGHQQKVRQERCPRGYRSRRGVCQPRRSRGYPSSPRPAVPIP